MSTWTGDFEIQTPADVTALSSHTCVTGRLTVYGDEVPSLEGLEDLVYVGGLGVASDAPDALLGAATGLDGLVQIGPFGLSIASLPSFSTTGLEGVAEVEGSVIVSLGDVDLAGLTGLLEVGGDLRLGQQRNPMSVGSLSALAGVARIGGHIKIHETDLQSLAGLGGVTEFSGDLEIVENVELVSIGDLQGLDVVDDVTITGNTALPTCDAQAFVAGLSPTGLVEVADNKSDACGP